MASDGGSPLNPLEVAIELQDEINRQQAALIAARRLVGPLPPPSRRLRLRWWWAERRRRARDAVRVLRGAHLE